MIFLYVWMGWFLVQLSFNVGILLFSEILRTEGHLVPAPKNIVRYFLFWPLIMIDLFKRKSKFLRIEESKAIIL